MEACRGEGQLRQVPLKEDKGPGGARGLDGRRPRRGIVAPPLPRRPHHVRQLKRSQHVGGPQLTLGRNSTKLARLMSEETMVDPENTTSRFSSHRKHRKITKRHSMRRSRSRLIFLSDASWSGFSVR